MHRKQPIDHPQIKKQEGKLPNGQTKAQQRIGKSMNIPAVIRMAGGATTDRGLLDAGRS